MKVYDRNVVPCHICGHVPEMDSAEDGKSIVVACTECINPYVAHGDTFAKAISVWDREQKRREKPKLNGLKRWYHSLMVHKLAIM